MLGTLEAAATGTERGSRAWVGFLVLAGLVALLAAGKAILADTLDPDCFWHLRVADEIGRQGWPRPLVDDLSFESSKEPWTPYSWLAELGMKKLWDVGGYRAAVVAQAGMEWGFLFLLALAGVEASRAVAGEPRLIASALAAVVGGILSLAYLSFRPVTVALLLLAIIGWLLLRDRRLGGRSKAVWLTPILTALAINVHFFALLAPLWAGALVVGDAIEKRSTRRGWILAGTSLAASLMTPMLPGTLAAVWNYAFNDVVVNSARLGEMRPFYVGFMGNISAVLVILISICAVRSFAAKRLRWGEMIWLVGMGILLMKVGRSSPAFAIIGCPLLAATMPVMSDRILGKKPVILGAAVVAMMGIGKLAMEAPAAGEPISRWLNRNGPGAPNFPCAAADYVERNVTPVSGRLLCNFNWGGYLEWRFPGKFQVLMDGRTQVFPAEFWRTIFFGSPDDYLRLVRQSGADAAVLPKGHSALHQALATLNWRMVFQDDFAEVWLPP
ncbi:MAG: hypothetical protein ABSF29_09335 [Tepidisphaeraceae bacterium]|jgi:hypothetical protein